MAGRPHDRLVQQLLALPELRYRLRVLSELLDRDDELFPLVLDSLCSAGDGGGHGERESLLAFAIALATLGEGPTVWRLRRAVATQGLEALGRLVRAGSSRLEEEGDPGVPPATAAGRELTLGERRALARQPTRRAVERLVRDPHPAVLRLLLRNPKLTEADVLRVWARRPTHRDLLRALLDAPEWLRNPRVRLALILNPSCPSAVSTPLVALCSRPELHLLVASPKLSGELRALSSELIARRPPWPEEADPTLH